MRGAGGSSPRGRGKGGAGARCRGTSAPHMVQKDAHAVTKTCPSWDETTGWRKTGNQILASVTAGPPSRHVHRHSAGGRSSKSGIGWGSPQSVGNGGKERSLIRISYTLPEPERPYISCRSNTAGDPRGGKRRKRGVLGRPPIPRKRPRPLRGEAYLETPSEAHRSK